MALTQVTGPYPIFTDLDGTPLDDGYLYIGAINQDPEQNPIQVYWDANLTIQATQPIRTSNGYAYRNGTPALLYTAGEFSITIRNKREEFVLYSPVGYGFDPAAVSASVVKNDFIGDGVTINFTLSSAPSTKLATNAFINGVYQEKDSYSLTGNVITFSIAPPLNSSIEIMTNETGVINAGNATAISYTLTEPGAVQQTVQTKLEQYVSVKDFGAVGDGVVDDTAAIQAAIDSGSSGITFPSGTYKVTSSITITAASTVRNITGIGNVVLKLYTAVQSQIFFLPSPSPSFPTKQFLTIDNLVLDSNGTKTDGLTTYGILAVNPSYCQFNNIRATNFSGAGLELRGSVYVGIANYTAGSCFYGLSFQLNPSGTQCTATQVDRAYVSGCTRAVTQTGAVNMIYNDIVMEYSGSSITNDGALHIAGGTATFNVPYFEANDRNLVSVDGSITVNQPYGWETGTAPDIVTYVGTASNERGVTLSFPYKTTMARLNADATSNRDLVIGDNLTVPLAGGSVQFGNQTMAVASGTLTSATWTTVYTIPAAEVTGTAVNLKAMYEYTCYAGASDLSTGFDAGTIMNGTLRSYSGSTPAWLRLDSNTVQMNVTGTSYGLNYKIVMRRIYPS